MASTKGGHGSHRKGIELEKFKRRMIRSVARRIREKKEDIWEEMKKEIGSNCQKLWERMRMLTLKKLKLLLEADDRVDMIGPVARMTLTDWLLFDLVIVHEKIDVIDRDKLNGDYHSKVLSNLFSLVQRFEIEGRSGDDLAEAWTAATVYYNSKGHQCSPMMLQRRWFQIKELTRHKFYKFWFNYRGNQRQLTTAMEDSPDKLQKAIALKYPTIVTQKFLNWEEAIQNRTVILPDELGVKMRQKSFMKPSDTTAPDVVLIEPRIEVIDLGANSDSEDEEELQNEGSETQPPLVQIKSEPVEFGEEFEEEHEVYYPPEKGSEFDEEIERLEKVGENLDDDSQSHINKSKAGLIEPSNNDSEAESPDNEAAKETEDSVGGSTLGNDDDLNTTQVIEQAIDIDDEDDEPCSQGSVSTADTAQLQTLVTANDEESVEKDCHIDETTDNHRTTGVIAEITSVASAGIKVENVDDVIGQGLNVESLADNAPHELLPVISTVSSAGVKVERDSTISYNTIDSDDDIMSTNIDVEVADNCVTENTKNLDQHDITSEALPIISTVSSKGVKVEIEIEIDNIQTEDPTNSNVDDIVSHDTVNKPVSSLVIEKDSAKVIDLDEFGDIPMDLNFADEGIDFADDGIAYVEEDEDDIIIVKDLQSIKTESKTAEKEPVGNGVTEEESEGEESFVEEDETTATQKFDLKLLMYPVVYTTKLHDMAVYDDPSHYEQVYDKELISKIHTLSKPVSKQSVSMSEQVIEQEHNDTVENTEQLENSEITNVSDDDLFRNESIQESDDSDSKFEVIDDSKRVKPSSYMLQKPRFRSYNPVALCKNPDFNTRLKKLTVGFFMSARNRTLLQSCIPMTIDMSKAFEDKLIDGTLYLKPTATNSTPIINITDNVEITSAALVKPSTVQQSLMSIDDTLENELKKCMADRVRGINLPDISQVRRLNQHLLTAEVTPLISQNEQSVQIGTKLGPANYVQNIKDDINNLLSQQIAKEVSNTDTNINMESQLCPLSEMQPRSPSLQVSNSETVTNTTVQPTPPMISFNSPTAQPMVRPPHPGMLRNNAPSNQNALNQVNVTTSTSIQKVRKPIRKTVHPPIAWNKRPLFPNPINQEIHHSDALLTIDTLYKMLSALDPCTKIDAYDPKKKSHKKKVPPKEKDDNSNQIIDITEDEAPVKKAKKKPKSKTSIRIKDKEYCCWCRYRIESIQCNKLFPTKRHKCLPNKCVCCCSALYYEGDLATILTAEPTETVQKEQHISQTIKHVVQLVNQIEVTKPTADSSTQIDLDDDAQVEPDSGISLSNKAVLSQTTDKTLDKHNTVLDTSNDGSAELTPLHSSQSKQPTPKIRVYASGSKFNVNTAACNTGPRVPTLTNTYVNNKPDVVNHKPNKADEFVHFKLKPSKDTKAKPFSNLPKTCTCGPTISKVNQGKIEINGKNYCPLHKKQLKESKIVLSKKLITNENQPFFVGKGKILLTNIRMPSKKIDPLVPLPPLSPIRTMCEPTVQTVSLPAGVQIVLLPDQTLTYITQPDVTLTPEECAVLPQFLIAIQQEINAIGITLPADHPIARCDEVIDLDKYESSGPKNSNNAENTQTAKESIELMQPPSEVEVIFPKEIIGPKTQEVFVMDIDRVAKEKGATESEDFEMSIDTISAQNIGSVSTENGVASAAKKIDQIGNFEAETRYVGAGTDVLDKKSYVGTSEINSSNVDEATNKKSLLSDLMEMSGIMEEDLAPTQVATPPESILLDAQNFILRKEVTSQNKVTLKNERCTSPDQHYMATTKNGSFELSAVTSFAELKYSCDNNGIFFKLDLESGQLTSINVCIQKFPSKSQPHYSDKCVIDLTDDPDISITGSTDDGSAISISHQNSVVTLNEKTEQSPLEKTRISTILQKKQRLMERLSNNLKPVNILQSKKHVARILRRNKTLHRDPQFTFYSKRKLEKIEAKIDLVDSDAPMEEEYLLSDDSSDDEPLIRKVKRKRLNDSPVACTDTELNKQDEELTLNEPPSEIQESSREPQIIAPRDSSEEQLQSNVIEHSIDQSNVQRNPVEPEQIDVQDKKGEEKQLNVNEEPSDEQVLDEQEPDYIDQEAEMDSQTCHTMGPVPTNLVLSGGALNAHNIPLNTNFRADGDDSQDEDCILGV